MTNLRVAKYDAQGVQIDDPNMIRQNVVWNPVTQVLSQEGQPIAAGFSGVTIDQLNAAIAAAISYSTDLGNATGVLPAANVILNNMGGINQQQYDDQIQIALVSLGTVVPQNTVQPAAATGTTSVNSTLTGGQGTWTGATSYLYKWFRENATTGVRTDTGRAPSATATYVVQPADYGYKMIQAVAGVNSAGISGYVFAAAATAVITATLATNSVQPSFSPSGAQTSGVSTTLSVGTWANAVSYGIQLYLGAAPLGSLVQQTGTTLIVQTADAMNGLVLSATVVAYNAQGIISTAGGASPINSSNTLTLNGAVGAAASPNVVINTATVYEGVGFQIVPATWNVPVTVQSWDVYVGVTLAASFSASVFPTGNFTFTPNTAATMSQILQNAGYTTLVGAAIKVVENVIYNSNSYTSTSASKTVNAASATLVVQNAVTDIQWTVGQQSTAVIPNIVVGGTPPYTRTVSPALPSPGAMNPQTGQIAAFTPGAETANITYTETIRDSAAAPATVTQEFTAIVNPAAVSSLPYPVSPNYELEAPSDSDGSSYASKAYSNGNNIPPLTNIATITRGGIVKIGPSSVVGTPAIIHRINQGDPLRNGGNRSELAYANFNFANAEDIWFALACVLDSDYDPSGSSGDQQININVHQEATSTYNPFGLLIVGGGSHAGLNWQVSYQGNDVYLYNTALPPRNRLFRAITHYRSGFAASGHAPIMEAWYASGSAEYTKLPPLFPGAANQSFGEPLSTPGSNNDFFKEGIYKFGLTYGARISRTHKSIVYAGKGVNLFNQAAAAVLWAKRDDVITFP